MAKNDLLQEIANRANAGELYLESWLATLPDPDPILRKKGAYARILEDLTADDQVCTAMQERKLKTLLKQNYRFKPGAAEGEEPEPEAEELCKALSADLEDIDLYNLISQVLDAPYFGYTPAEIYWRPDGWGRMRIKDIIVKPRHWFGWNPDNQFCFLRNGIMAEVPPEHKFIVARHFPTYENPYGLRLLSRCLWPVAFKKGGVKFWVKFCEKFGFPWVLGQAQNMDAAKRDAAAASLAAMIRDAVAVVSGVDVKVHEFGGKSSGELHKSLVTYWDAAISKVLMGQTLTAEIGSTGSYAAAQTHYNVLDDFAKADARLVKAFMDDLAWSYGQLNASPGVRAPYFKYDEPEDLQAAAELDGKLYEQGVRFRKKHYVNKYGLSEDAFDLASSEVKNESRTEPASFAAPDEPEAVGQDLADELADKVVAEAEKELQRSGEALLALVEKAESYEDARLLLAEALGPESDDALADTLLNGMLNAALLGRWSAREEAE